MNHGHGELLAAMPIRDLAVSHVSLEPAIDLGLVPALGVPYVSDSEVILLTPEERHGVEPLAPTEHVARCGLSLALSHHPVFDPDALASEAVRPACNVARPRRCPARSSRGIH